MDTGAYAAFLETIPGGAAVVDRDSRVVMINRRAREMLGAPALFEGLELQLGDGSARVRTLQRFDGGVESFSMRTSPVRLEGVELTLALISPLDDEERVRQALRLVGNMGVFDHDHLTDLLYVSPEHRAIFGLPPDARVSLPDIVAMLHPDDRDRVNAAIDRAHDPSGDGRFDLDYRIVRPDGEVRWIATRSVTSFAGEGAARRAVRTVGAKIDVTDRRRDEAAMRTWAHAVESSSTGLAVTDLDGRITFANPALREHWGLAAGTVVCDTLADHCASHEVCAQALAGTKLDGRWSGEVEGRRVDGTRFPALVSLSTVTDQSGRPVNLVASFVDITERARAEAERRRLADLLDATPDIVSLTRMNREFLYINRAARRLRGIGEHQSLAGQKLGATLKREELENLEAGFAYAAEHGTWLGESRMASASGEPKELSVLVQVHGEGEERTVSIISRDISPQRRLEAQLRQAVKMEAIGRLAGGVAHDFNNLLTVINLNAEMLLGNRDLPASVREDVQLILDAGLSAGSLTRQLLAFSRKQLLQPTSLDVNELVVGVEKMLRRVIGEDIELRTDRAAALWKTRVDRGQMEQVLVNLAVNARDAMSRGGTLTIATSNVSLDDAYVLQHPDATPGEHVRLTVRDDGEGMAPETLQRIFEPFFTTKGARGTGLGLSTVYGIVRQSGGHVEVISQPGRGTEFQLYFPRDVDAPLPAAAPRPAPPRDERCATILLVEDAAGVREVIRRFLVRRGHRVLTAARPDDALVVAGQVPKLDLLITDVVMPGRSGRELADALGQSHRSLQVLFMSGYAASEIVHDHVLDVGLDFIAKPFSLDAFGQKVAELLSRRNDPGTPATPSP